MVMNIPGAATVAAWGGGDHGLPSRPQAMLAAASAVSAVGNRGA